MAQCEVCGEYDSLPYHCRFCGGTHCGKHRLPEKHGCAGLNNWNDPKGVFDSGFDDSVQTGRKSRSITDRLPVGTNGWAAYFRGNVTFLFLGLMWATFFLQYFLVPFVLDPFGSLGMTFASRDIWEALFVISPEHPEYVWTWVTSIFAHGGFGHIAVNSIVIYFFGRIVEEYVGSRDFAMLFIGSGILAGLAQIVSQIAVGGTVGALGASGAALAIMGVLTIVNPRLRVYLYFILPIPLWILTIGYAAFTVFAIFGPGGNPGSGGVAQVAHLIGLVVGLWYGGRVKRRIRRIPNQLQFGGGMGGRRRF